MRETERSKDEMADNPVQKTLIVTYRAVRRVTVAIVGASVVIVGVAMIFLPGPAFVVIPAGLGILGLEFTFARRWLRHLKETGQGAILKWRKVLTSETDAEADAQTGDRAEAKRGEETDLGGQEDLDADRNDPREGAGEPGEGAKGAQARRGSTRSDAG